VSRDAGDERLVAGNRHLAPYGVGGDYVGARRGRRAFRLLVLTCVALTFSLYFVEHYLRYSLNDVQYRMALTLEDDSQRAILRNVVRRDAEQREVPTARYVEALANIEEEDVVLERFAEAVKLAPDKGSLLIMYGCKLFQQGQYQEARQVFREASLKTSRNALPKYLHAAALAGASGTEEDFRTALAQVTRANDSGEQVIFPQPLWHESLPREGAWYAALQRRLADQCCAPLYHLKNVVTRRAQEQATNDEVQVWDTWLAQLQIMGEHLVGGPESAPENLGTSQAIYGLQIQKDVISMRLMLGEKRGAAPDAALIERRVKIQEGMARLQAFEVERERLIKEARTRTIQPLRLSGFGFLLLLMTWSTFALLSKPFGTDKNARTLRHGRRCLIAVWGWAAGLFLVLVSLSSLGEGMLYLQVGLGVLWYVMVGGAMLWALAYPAFTLPRPTAVCNDLATEPYYDDKVLEARACRRRAYLSLGTRLAGMQLGALLVVLCLWIVGYRIASGLYPTDVKLLLPGFEAQAVSLVQRIHALLVS